MRSVVAPVVLAAILLTASLAPAHAQVDSREGIALQNEIYELRQELKSVQDQMSRGGGSGNRAPSYYAPPPQQSGSNDLLAQLLTRVDQLEEQVRQLRGRMDQTQNQLQQQNADLGKRIDDLAFQVNSQGSSPPPQRSQPQGAQSQVMQTQPLGTQLRGGQPGTQALPPPPAYQDQGPAPIQLGQPASARPTPPRSPETALQDGNAALGRRDYAAAETAAREVLANRTSPRAYDARLLLAKALYGEHQYAQAAIAFDDSYNSSHKGTHAQDALVGLAGSLAAINEKKAACDTLTRLHTEFPQPRPDIASDATAAAQKTGCH